MANLAIHRQRKEEINQERMRYDHILQEAATQQAREANKGKTREVVPDSEDEFVSRFANQTIRMLRNGLNRVVGGGCVIQGWIVIGRSGGVGIAEDMGN
ncbi:hypothetical protein PIB30_082803 [Stylosanthes scabra]|uniref:Uncharacterized protein n=1 Tax=Stylosanthes scabra TaxID=79078 RepID=A0ABU6WQF3_9FABA|nr:hypothetical protein [Stylosanthes scabra]